MYGYIMVFESSIGVKTSGIYCIIIALSIFLFIFLYAKLFKENANKRIKYAAVLTFLMSGMMFYGSCVRYKENIVVADAIKSQKFYVCKGIIRNFHAMPKGGHEAEYFDVNDTHFEILFTGDYPNSKTLFYTLTKNRNGPIQKNGQKVKIHYIIVGGENKIIKMWVYNGETTAQ